MNWIIVVEKEIWTGRWYYHLYTYTKNIDKYNHGDWRFYISKIIWYDHSRLLVCIDTRFVEIWIWRYLLNVYVKTFILVWEGCNVVDWYRGCHDILEPRLYMATYIPRVSYYMQTMIQRFYKLVIWNITALGERY